ncbi:hypothetical protein QVD17_27264 [Tagetes erecta]|uniref:Uncharacterized protein n=1 Tax=Tagetes erecta TaxID=13708 RepID=A0AAD8NJ82_TARER|nr:hypothetical protein QVD17_27264 [Tagetes erecta]
MVMVLPADGGVLVAEAKDPLTNPHLSTQHLIKDGDFKRDNEKKQKHPGPKRNSGGEEKWRSQMSPSIKLLPRRNCQRWPMTTMRLVLRISGLLKRTEMLSQGSCLGPVSLLM